MFMHEIEDDKKCMDKLSLARRNMMFMLLPSSQCKCVLTCWWIIIEYPEPISNSFVLLLPRSLYLWETNQNRLTKRKSQKDAICVYEIR